VLIFVTHFYGFKHNSREEHRLRMYENRALRIFEPKREEVAGD
jgi:hypothetical protein